MKKVKFLLVLLAMFSLTSFVFVGMPMVVENAAGETVELPVSFVGLFAFAMGLFASLVFGVTIVLLDDINNYLGNIKLGERKDEKRVRYAVPLWRLSFVFALLIVMVLIVMVIINPEKHVSNYEKLLLLCMQLTIFFGALGIYAYRFRERVRIQLLVGTTVIYHIVWYIVLIVLGFGLLLETSCFWEIYLASFTMYILLVVVSIGLPMGFRFIKNLIEKKKKTS